MRVTFFFPDNAKLKPVSVVGQVPSVGDFVYFSTYELTGTDGRDYSKQNKWKVNRIDYSVRASTRDVYETSYNAEVHVVVPAEGS